MKITVALNNKSIKDAIKQLNNVKKQMVTNIVPEYLELVCKWLIDRASWYVTNSDIGENVKADINSHWSYTITGNSAKIVNDSDKAVFVEFGVGSMGARIPHENASQTGYNYNVHDRTYWVYPVKSLEDVDMHKGYKTADGGDNIWIITKGSWRVMFAYQAIVDAKEDLRNPNGELAKLWRGVKVRYIK